MQANVQRARAWLMGLARRPIHANRPRAVPRRLLMPELLESRNAPGAMLPLPAVFSSFADENGNATLLFEEAQRREVRTYYRSDAVPSSAELHFSIQNFVDALRAAEAASQLNQAKIATVRQTTEFLTPARVVAVNRAFESFNADDVYSLIAASLLVPPPIIHPVEPPEEEPQEDLEPPSAPEAIAQPTPTGSERNGGTAFMAGATAPREDASATPPVIVTEPIGEVPPGGASDPVPSSPAELPELSAIVPPPMIQPVIMDPESEHNQPSL